MCEENCTVHTKIEVNMLRMVRMLFVGMGGGMASVDENPSQGRPSMSVLVCAYLSV